MVRFPGCGANGVRVAAVICWVCGVISMSAAAAERELRLITLDPGHFHAALFQKEMLAGVSNEVHIYAPLGPDLAAHLNRIAQYNTRAQNPARWKLEIHAAADSFERLLRERPGDIVVMSGNNRGKIGRIRPIIGAKLHILADKPWIIEAEDLPALRAALELADQQHVIAYDAMTQRFDVPRILQREIVNDPAIFGQVIPGSEAEPGVRMENVHHLLKEVSGVVNLRPVWFFDVHQQGEAMVDVGPHLVDLAQWTLFPDQAIDCQKDISVLGGSRRAIFLTLAQFQRVTGQREFPAFLAGSVRGDRLEYYADDTVHYTIRGVHVRLDARWAFEAAAGESDTELAVFRGGKSRIELRQNKAEKYRPEVYILPNRDADRAEIIAALKKRIDSLQVRFPGLAFAEQPDCIRIVIPEACRSGHEAHFALLTRRFLEYVRNPTSLPAWEKPNMIAKYYVTTRGVELARQAKEGRGP